MFTFSYSTLFIFKFILNFIKNDRMRDEDANKLKEEYQRLVEGLKDAQVSRETDVVLANPVLPDEILEGDH